MFENRSAKYFSLQSKISNLPSPCHIFKRRAHDPRSMRRLWLNIKGQHRSPRPKTVTWAPPIADARHSSGVKTEVWNLTNSSHPSQWMSEIQPQSSAPRMSFGIMLGTVTSPVVGTSTYTTCFQNMTHEHARTKTSGKVSVCSRFFLTKTHKDSKRRPKTSRMFVSKSSPWFATISCAGYCFKSCFSHHTRPRAEACMRREAVSFWTDECFTT